MSPALNTILRHGCLALLSLGLVGLSGCKQHFHPQYAHAIGGGTIGKGPSSGGKKRSISAHENADQLGRASSFGRDPMSGLLDTPRDGKAPKKPSSSMSAATNHSNKPPKAENPFGGGKGEGLGGSDPFSGH